MTPSVSKEKQQKNKSRLGVRIMRGYARLFKYRVFKTEDLALGEIITWVLVSVSLYVLAFTGAPLLDALLHGATLDGYYVAVHGKNQGASVHTIRSGLLYTLPLFATALLAAFSYFAYRRGWLDRYQTPCINNVKRNG